MYGVKFFATMFAVALLIGVISSPKGLAQGPGKPMEPARDATLEISAKHNLDVARWYLLKRKAYEGARDRLQEILDTYPDFSRTDEVMFLMGEAQIKLGKNDKAADSFSTLLKAYPESEFAKKARARLEELRVKRDA